jgi:hypothetical protein
LATYLEPLHIFQLRLAKNVRNRLQSLSTLSFYILTSCSFSQQFRIHDFLVHILISWLLSGITIFPQSLNSSVRISGGSRCVVASLEKVESTIPKWYMKADYVETCNCDYGCPCNFNGFPTYGFCRALLLFSIREGSNYGDDTKLDGVDVIVAQSWPRLFMKETGLFRCTFQNTQLKTSAMQ